MFNVLMVEDDSVVRGIFKRCLADEGFEVFEASNGAEALRDFGRPLDLILLDIRIPDMESQDLLDRLQERHPGTKVVVCSCHAPAVQMEMVSSATAYFDKTNGCNALLQQIESILPFRNVS